MGIANVEEAYWLGSLAWSAPIGRNGLTHVQSTGGREGCTSCSGFSRQLSEHREETRDEIHFRLGVYRFHLRFGL